MDEITRTIVKPADRGLVSKLKGHAYKTCRTLISQEYINNSLNKFKRGFVYKNGTETQGFTLWKEMIEEKHMSMSTGKIEPAYKYLYVLLICTERNNIRLGSKILEDLDVYCMENGIEYITLEPLNDNVMLFYEKNGFLLTSTGPRKIMTKRIQTFQISRRSGKTMRLRSKPEPTIRKKIDDIFSMTPEEARRALNYNLNLTSTNGSYGMLSSA